MMKRLLVLFAVILVSAGCGGLDLPEDPKVPQATCFEVSAQISSLSGEFIWSEGRAIGVYGSEKGSNAKYVAYNEYHGQSGLVRLYGEEVDGELVAYFPYREEGYEAVAQGLCPYLPVQQYCSSASDHYARNIVLASKAYDGKFSFQHKAGLIRFTVNIDREGEVKSVRLVSGVNALCGNFPIDANSDQEVMAPGNTLTVRGMGMAQGNSFDVWFALPEGTYEALQLSVNTDKAELSKPVNGTVPVRAGEVTNMTVKDESYEYTGSDFEIIGGIFD